jgi:hypothetical protein
MTTIVIKNGMFNNEHIEDKTFKMVKSPRVGKHGLYVTVDGNLTDGFPSRNIRVLLTSNRDVMQIDGPPTASIDTIDVVTQTIETDEEVMVRMRQKFEVLDDMTRASCDGIVRGLIVTGPPGIGKSFGIEQIVGEFDVMNTLGGEDGAKCGVEKGSASPIGLFMLLHQYSKPGSVLVLDDSDTMLYDETALNLLKAALDSGRKRTLSWHSQTLALKANNVPNTYEFHGSVIFITNLDFAAHRGRLAPHLGALISRCHYLDMDINGTREKFLRCKQIVQDGMLSGYNFSEQTEAEILDFIDSNKHRLRELSLRMVTKIADLRKMNPDKWKMYAENTCLSK